ncbi:Uncharacterised protein [Klebsiella variicola]|nr:Uncharacterised protein [Klebsiella variicola]
MNRFIDDLLHLTPFELLVVVFTPVSGITLSAAFFLG